jgi:hypothetical protein
MQRRGRLPYAPVRRDRPVNPAGIRAGTISRRRSGYATTVNKEVEGMPGWLWILLIVLIVLFLFGGFGYARR